MSEMAQAGFGVQVLWNTTLVGEVNGDVSLPDSTANETDSTSHDNLGGINSKYLTSITQGDGTFKIFYYGSTVQKSLWTDHIARTIRPCMVIMPMSFAGGGISYKFNAQIKSIKRVIPQNGLVNWDITMTPVSAVTEVVTGADGLTTTFFSIADDDSNNLTPTETPATATYEYNVECYSDNTYVKVTPIAAAGTIYVNGTAVGTGVASGEITAPANIGDVIMIIIMVTEANKTPKVYKIRVQKGLTAHP
jgi:hypothetical protein